jgi:hypothetical protein
MYDSLMRHQNYPVIVCLRISKDTHAKLIEEAKNRKLDGTTKTGKPRSGYQIAARLILEEYFQ